MLKGSRQKVKDATIREAYEHEHGPGSWERRANRQWWIVWCIGLAAAAVGPLAIASRFVPELEPGATGPAVAAGLGGAVVYAIISIGLARFTRLTEASAARDLARGVAGSIEATRSSFIVQHPVVGISLVVTVIAASTAALVAAGFLTVRAFTHPNVPPEGLALVGLAVYIVVLAAVAVFGLVAWMATRK